MLRSHKSSQQSQANQQKQSLIPQCKICPYWENKRKTESASDICICFADSFKIMFLSFKVSHLRRRSLGTKNVKQRTHPIFFISESEDSLQSEGLQIHKSPPSMEIVKYIYRQNWVIYMIKFDICSLDEWHLDILSCNIDSLTGLIWSWKDSFPSVRLQTVTDTLRYKWR